MPEEIASDPELQDGTPVRDSAREDAPATAAGDAGGFISRHPLATVAILALLAVVPFHTSRGLYETTEGRYAECARQTMITGKWDQPVLNGEHHWTKPPLTYMAIGGGIRLFGCNTLGARAYLVPCFLVTVLAVYWLAFNLFGPRAALLAAVIHASSPLVMVSTQVVSADVPLVMWEALALAAFWHAVRRRNRWFVVLSWALLGMAFVTKGPPALLPLLALVPVSLVIKRRGIDAPSLFSPLNLLGLLCFLVLGLSWYVVEAFRHEGLASYWLLSEVVKRNFTGASNRNSEWYKSITVYAPVIIFAAGPWLFWALWRLRGRWEVLDSRRDEAGRIKVEWLFLLLSFFLPLLVFLVSRSRLHLYALPLSVPLSVALGEVFVRLESRRAVSTRAIGVLAVAMILAFAVGKGIWPRVTRSRDMRPLAQSMEEVCAASPGLEIYRCGRELNGLQYYLRREIPTVSVKKTRHLLNDSRPLVVVMDEKDVRKLKSVPDLNVLRIEGMPYALVSPGSKP